MSAMNPEKWRQVERLYHSALEREAEQRASFLATACEGDDSLRREVETLLAHQSQAENLLETPVMEIAAKALADDQNGSMTGQSLGSYQILSRLGAGGMGEVYQARDARLERTVALKILPAEVAADAERIRRFVREAKAASALNHPHVATIYEIGMTDGVNFIAMEYVEGQTLAARINSHPLKVNEIVEIGSQIADALDEAHSKGITHRDIKPANVMITPRGQVKVLDFGLAKMTRAIQPISSDISTQAKTETGMVMGTVPYMSPEQALGREVDHRSDVFSLGVTLYEMATGRLPFAGANSSETLDRILHAQPEAMARFNSDVPAELERIALKCFAKEREVRYQTIKELLNDLVVLKGDAVAPRATPKTEDFGGKIKRHKLGLAVVLVAMAVIIVVAVYMASLIRHRFQAAQPAIRPLRRLTFDPGLQSEPTWSPNNDFIAYSSDRGGNFGIWVQPISGGNPIQVTQSPAYDWQPDWSPDGSQIVFRSEREGGGLFVVPAFGGRERKISSFGFHPQWSPDGRKVLFGITGFKPKVYVVTLDGQPPGEVQSEVLGERLTVGVGSDTDIAISPDGKRLAFTTRTETNRAWSLPFDARAGIIKGQGQPITRAGINPEPLNLSPDGKKIVYIAKPSGSQKVELWEKSLADSHETLLAVGRTIFTPCWSRDGSRIAYRGIRPEISNRDGRSIMALPAGGGDEKVIASGADDLVWDWTVDGQWILVTTDRNSPRKFGQLCLYPLSASPHAETQMRVITSNPEYNLFQARLSPDDRWVCFMGQKRGDTNGIYLVSASGGAWTQITDGKYRDDKAKWSPDGKTIYFISNRGGFFNVWGIRFDPTQGKPVGEPFRVTSFENPGRMIAPDIGYVDLGITANRLVLPILEVSGSIWILENVDR